MGGSRFTACNLKFDNYCLKAAKNVHKDNANGKQPHVQKLIHSTFYKSVLDCKTDFKADALILIHHSFAVFRKSSFGTIQPQSFYLLSICIKRYDNILIVCTVITTITKLFNERLMPGEKKKE